MKNNNLTFGLEFESDYLYLVTNNVNLRSYLSLDSIVANSCLETSNYYQMDSSIFNDFILLSKKAINTNSKILEEDNLYKIILEIDIKSVDVHVLSGNEQGIRMSNIREIETFGSDNILVFGAIPFQFVKRIIFKNIEEQNRFNYTISNIFYPTYLFDVNENIFYDQKDIDTTLLRDVVKQYISRNRIEVSQPIVTVQYRNKIKAIVNEFLFNNEYIFSGLKFNFDTNCLDILNISKIDRTRLSKNINEIAKTHKFREIKKVNYLKINKQDTFLSNLGNILDLLILDNRKAVNKNTNLNPELILFYEIISILIKRNYLEHFNTDSFISLLVINLRLYNNLILEKYISDIKSILIEVLNDNLSIRKILKSNEIESKTIVALMIFLKSPSFSSSEELKKNLDSYDTCFEVRKIVLIFYNALNGYAALDSASKADCFINRVCDMFAFNLTRNKYLISECIDEKKFITYCPKDEFTFYTSSYVPLKIQLHYTDDEILSEKCRHSIKNSINDDPGISKKILNSIFKRESKLRNLLPIKVYIDKNHIDNLINSEETLAFSISNQSLIKTEFDIFKFEDIIFNNPKLFFTLFNADRDIWNTFLNRR